MRSFDVVTGGAASRAFKRKAFAGKAGELLSLDAKPPLEKVFIAGLGEKKDLSAHAVRRACGAMAAACQSQGLKSLAMELPPGDAKQAARAAVEAALAASYAFDKYKSKEPGAPKFALEELVVCAPASRRDAGEGAELGRVLGEAANFARELDNEPANVATPEFLAKSALSLQGRGLKVTVFGKKALERLGARALLAVGSGSANEPRLVLMEWGGGKGGVAFVGKGITFDSGGISIKPSQDMDKMKFDKSGACAVIGIMKAVKELKLSQRVVGVFAAAENMPGCRAYKPGDIVRAMNGKTIEVLNTDAEGRVMMADALAFAERQGVDSIIDFATLTGACAVALGDVASGLMYNDDALCERVRRAGEASGERVWPFPNWPEYDEKVKSDFADVKNIGEPGSAGTIAGASFLKLFVGKCKWCHVDIAATAQNVKPKAYIALGATGVGVRLGMEFLLQTER